MLLPLGIHAHSRLLVWRARISSSGTIRVLLSATVLSLSLVILAHQVQGLSVEIGGASRVNVLLITSDTTRYDALGSYGGEAVTRCLDALGADGVIMEQAFAVAFGTNPSHASLMTSLPAAKHGLYNNETILSPERSTLAEVLRSAGYSTAAFVSSRPLDHRVGLAQGFNLYNDEFTFDESTGLGQYSTAERRADATVDHFLGWMRSDPRRPFFAWIHFMDPHQPYWPPGTGHGEEPVYLHVEGDLLARMQADSTFRDELETDARGRYRREIEFMDRELGRAIEYLKQQGLYDSTIIVFVADHGENFAEHGLNLSFDHAALFDSVSHIPLIIKLPFSEHRGTRVSGLVGNLDIAPTLIDRLSLPRPASWAGLSFQNLFSHPREAFRPYVILEGAAQEEIAVRTPASLYREVAGDLHNDADVLRYLGYAPGRPTEFYELATDPTERRNLYPSRRAESARNIAAGFLAERRPPSVQRIDSDQHREALKALGYLR